MGALTRAWLRVALLAALGLTAGHAHAQLVSPGDLARPHAAIDGVGQCTKCHPAGQQLAASACLDCHTELRARINQRRGFHGRLGETERNTCQSCHHEHEGRDARLIQWKPSKERFDHERAGWPLRGKHGSVKCADCHNPRTITDAAVQELLRKHPGTETYLGVGRACTTCHFDEHRAQLGARECETCHAETAWKPAPRFDHAKSDFPLTGLHRKVACEKCHPSKKDAAPHAGFPAPRSSTFSAYADLAHGKCADCHDDPHDGRFGKRCESCHATDGWRTIKKTADERAFHDKTRYPLRGLHAQVACVACHGPFPGKPARFKNMAFGKCMDCHKDAHAGQMSAPACERCHSVEGFSPARFELEEHRRSAFPLEGAHGAAPCSGCHPSDLKAVERLRGATVSGHAKGRVRARGKAKARHAEEPQLAAIVIKPAGRTDRCETCHADPHAGQFKDRADGCRACHDVASFTAVRFDHGKTRFPLTGKHAGAPCAGCHRAVATPGSSAPVVRYRALDTACASCHADVHLGQLRPATCDKCHVTASFKQVVFDHGDRRFTTFALDGKHRQVACDRCHTLVTVAGRALRRYRPLPRECEGCHADFHKGDFKGFEP